jgi:hypothetical protein
MLVSKESVRFTEWFVPAFAVGANRPRHKREGRGWAMLHVSRGFCGMLPKVLATLACEDFLHVIYHSVHPSCPPPLQPSSVQA